VKLSQEKIFRSSRKASGYALIAIAPLLLAGCVVGSKYHQPAAPAPPAYKEVGDGSPPSQMTRTLAVRGGRYFKIRNSMCSRRQSTYRIKI